MLLKKKIRVLVIDDSLVFRETLARGIAGDPSIEVVGTAADPFIARDKIIELEPDVLTLDVEMPRMNGIEFLKRLIPQYPVPVVVVSALGGNIFEALNAGAVDFVTKPDFSRKEGLDGFIRELVVKIKIASIAKVGARSLPAAGTGAGRRPVSARGTELIAIGASTGGTEAIYEIIRAFPAEMPGIVIVQHMPPVFTKMYAERLNNSCRMMVKEAQNGDIIIPGRVLIAPGDYHMTVKAGNSGLYVECKKGERINGHCPSVDVLFHSVSNIDGLSVIGVILTGMGYDGAKGLLQLKKKGAYTIGQDEGSSVVYGMPKVAYDIGAVVRQEKLGNISEAILSVL